MDTFEGQITVRMSGCSLGVAGPGRRRADKGRKRGVVCGWTRGAGRRNASWLQSVDWLSLEGYVVEAVTLTLRDMPTEAQWRRQLKLWIDRVMLSAVGVHLVVESTAAGLPHVHATIVSEVEGTGNRAVLDWLRRWEGTRSEGQHVDRVTGKKWARYVAKHGSRAVYHYQRNRPPGRSWASTGRMWTVRGDWPVVEPEVVDVDARTFWRLRRILRGYSRARVVPCKARQSRVRGVSVWIDVSTVAQVLEFLWNSETLSPEGLENHGTYVAGSRYGP